MTADKAYFTVPQVVISVVTRWGFSYVLLERGGGRDRGREASIRCLSSPQLRIWPPTQACALNGDRTHHP